MQKTLALLSTGVGLVPRLMRIVKEKAPDLKIINIVDDSIINEISANGNIVPPEVCSRICGYCSNAEQIGADALLLTCSSISETLDVAKSLTRLPLFKIDEPMAEQAVKSASTQIGVVATLETTLAPTCRQLQAKIGASGKNLGLEKRLCSDAFEAYLNGDTERHDELVKEAIGQLLDSCQVVVLAQASMASAIQRLPENVRSRVLTSPETGIAAVLDYLNGQGGVK